MNEIKPSVNISEKSRPSQRNHRRSDFGDLALRQTVALESIAESLSLLIGGVNEDPFLTFEEAAKAFQIGDDKLRDMVKSKELREGRHYIKAGKVYRFASNFIDLIFEDRSKANTESAAKPHVGSDQRPPHRGKRVSGKDTRSIININYR